MEYELDYFDGLKWNSIEKNITETSKSFTMPSIDTKSAKIRIRTYDKKEWSLHYLESSTFEIDSTIPQVELSINSSKWVNNNITINFSSDDNNGSGIADTEYSYTKLLSRDKWSEWTDYISGNSCNFTNDGVYKLKVRTIDNAGNLSDEKLSGEYKIDKTVPEDFIPNILAVSETEIETVDIKQCTNRIISNNSKKLIKINVNDKKFNYIGKVSADHNDGKNRLNVSLNSSNLIRTFENTKVEDVERNIVSIAIGRNYDVVVDGLNGLDVKQMEDKNVKLEIKNENASYTLPARQINIDSIAEKLGKKIKLKDIKVQIEISKPQEKEINKIESSVKQNEYELVVNPVNFEIQCSYNNKVVNVAKFNEYIERSITIPENVDYRKITTGVVINEDGTIYHVPTKVVKINGQYYAQINSLTNSSYTLIWNSFEFSDISKRKDKDKLNNMGARLIVNGIGNKLFEPDRDITRAEFIAILIKALGLNPTNLDNPFDDVNDSDWYCKYISTAYEYKIISGYTNGKFKPMSKITREEVFSIIARAMKITGLKIELTEGEMKKLFEQYSDKSEVSDWVKNYIAECIKAKVILIEQMDKILPKDTVTRAEGALIIRALLEKSNRYVNNFVYSLSPW